MQAWCTNGLRKLVLLGDRIIGVFIWKDIGRSDQVFLNASIKIFKTLTTSISPNPEWDPRNPDDLSPNFLPRSDARRAFFEDLSGQELSLSSWRGAHGEGFERGHGRWGWGS
jgi:hypothetical protein